MGRKALPLAAGYSAAFDEVSAGAWQDILARFSDSNLYQTWSYEVARRGEENVSHFVLRSGMRVVSAAQTRIVRTPLMGVAYVRWGPLWRLRGEADDLTDFRMAVREMRNEYVCRRGMVLRLLPALYGTDSGRYKSVLLEEGYESGRGHAQRTLVLDIQPPIDELRRNLEQKWRNGLNRAERNGLALIEGVEEELFVDFIGLYERLLERKRFRAPNDIGEFRTIQRQLPDALKMRIFLCKAGQSTSAGAVFSGVGETGVYLFGATSEEGMRNNASYLLQWKAIQWLKENGCRCYNLNGINPATNPGTYHFKAGVAGKRGMDVEYIGGFDSYTGPIAAKMTHGADLAFPIARRMVAALGRK